MLRTAARALRPRRVQRAWASSAEGTKPAPGDAAAGSDPNSEDSSSSLPSQPAESQSEVEALKTELEERDVQIAELNDRTLRVLAEMENVRTIARRDVENARKFGIVPFAKGLLDVADNLGLALKAVPEDVLSAADADPGLVGLHAGVRATERELLKVFAQHGMTRFGEVGDKFNPNMYQAIFEAPSPSAEPGTVIDVAKLGYAIDDRVLRPAEVGVAKAS